MNKQIKTVKLISKYANKGFTLIEILVVISIIGILAAISLASFTSAQRQARDTQRKSDLKQYQTSLEMFANKNTTYPSRTVAVLPSSICLTLGISGSCPTDPNKSQNYYYISDGAGSNSASNYVLWALLENQSNTYFIVCSNGKVGTSLSVPNSGTCPI